MRKEGYRIVDAYGFNDDQWWDDEWLHASHDVLEFLNDNPDVEYTFYTSGGCRCFVILESKLDRMKFRLKYGR